MVNITKIDKISEDFEQEAGPFADVTFPEERLLEELPHNSMEDRAILASMFATFDYNRDANRLVDNIIELHNMLDKYFDAEWVVESSDASALSMTMSDISFRYPSRDANAWHTNCELLVENYSGKWTELLLSVGADAPTLVEQLREDDFLVMRGDKVAPMYARIIDGEVAPLSNVWELEIPVDTHIRRLSKKLFDNSHITDDEIRATWRRLADRAGVERHVVDGAMWHIGNKWDEWGEDYWESLP